MTFPLIADVADMGLVINVRCICQSCVVNERSRFSFQGFVYLASLATENKLLACSLGATGSRKEKTTRETHQGTYSLTGIASLNQFP